MVNDTIEQQMLFIENMNLMNPANKLIDNYVFFVIFWLQTNETKK